MKRGLLFALLAALCLALTPALAQEGCEILFPSQAETTIVDGRDFYVIATVPGDADAAVVRLTNADGVDVRVITGGASPVFFLDHPALEAYNADSAEFWMPDLIFLPDRPDSLYDGSIKCYIKDGLLIAVIPGGFYRMDGRDIVDAEGVPYAPLPAGDYTLSIEAGGATLTRALSLGVTRSKVMSRFSPDGHLETVTTTASGNDIRTYFDPLPGYWSPSAILPGQAGNPYFAEIKERWQLADAMEYVSGTVHFFVYNLSPTCATVNVELGELQRDGNLDARVQSYHYDIGEPLLGYADALTDAYLMGTLVPFAADDWLAITRAEITPEKQDELFVVYEGEPRPIDLDVADGVTARTNQALTLFGVLRPIQNAPEDIVQVSQSVWDVKNRVTRIEYAFACDGETWTEIRDVGLNRMLAEGWKAYSIYEFAHSFVFDDRYVGKTISVAVRGFDAHGEPVKGTEEAFIIAVIE